MPKRKSTLALTTALIALAAAPGCGGHNSEKAQPKRSTIASSNVVVVDRTGSAPGSAKFRVPAHVVVTDRTRIRSLVTALKGLPGFPASVLHEMAGPPARHCPVDFSLRYELRFEVASSGGILTVARASVDPYGCESVTGFGYQRWAACSKSFWRVLGEAVGVRHATDAAFRGRVT